LRRHAVLLAVAGVCWIYYGSALHNSSLPSVCLRASTACVAKCKQSIDDLIKEQLGVKFGFMSVTLFDAEQLDCMLDALCTE